MNDMAKVIVVAEDNVYDFLKNSGVAWDVQHPVGTVSYMWDDFGSGKLDQNPSALFFSDMAPAAEWELESALAVMAPFAPTFLVVWDPDQMDDLLARVRQAAEDNQVDPDAPIYVVSPYDLTQMIDSVREVFEYQGLNGLVPPGLSFQGGLTYPNGEEAAEEWDAAQNPDMPGAAPYGTPEPPASAMPTPAPVGYGQPAPAPAPAQVPGLAPSAAPGYGQPPVPQMGSVPSMPGFDQNAGYGQQPGGQVDPLSKPPLPGQMTITVTSSKGGSGKSTTAMMLAAQIAQSSKKAGNPKKVVLVDMDTKDGQVASLISVFMPTALNIRTSPEWDEKTILDNLVTDHRLGIQALLAPIRPRTADDVGPDFYRHVIRMLQRTHDVVIMDTSVQYTDPLISTVCLPEASAILFVTTLATTSVQGMARALREITEPVETGSMGISRKKIGIVVNQSATGIGMDRDQILQAALRVRIVGAIPLATLDVLAATNNNRMHLLLKHPSLGPAYYRLAKACLPNADLAPLIEGSEESEPTQPGTVAAPGAPEANPAASRPAPQAKRGGFFGRKN